MSYIIADNITSPLGFHTEENVRNVLDGKSCLKRYDGHWNLPESFVASLFTDGQRDALSQEGLTFFESVAVVSISRALAHVSPSVLSDLKSTRVLFVLSTTKGNVSLLSEDIEYILPSDSAKRISQSVGLDSDEIVVCNACISGLSALILANRMLDCGKYAYAVVCGIDVQSDFIVSGFQSFKALSSQECRPFDIERLGLNLGEAAATIILASHKTTSCWKITDGAMSNDAYHISAPSKKGIGLQKVLHTLMAHHGEEEMAFINAHGTATLFNDQMEGCAIRECGLTNIPILGLKGYFGHTMGAAGVLETIVCMHCLDKGVIPGTRGFSEIGVSANLDISNELRQTDKKSFVKLLSGFGGSNAGIVCTWDDEREEESKSCNLVTRHEVLMTESEVIVDGKQLETNFQGMDMVKELYKTYDDDYPKFYKMDRTCRLGFMASELLLSQEGERFVERDDRGVILFNYHTTTDTDRKFYASISDKEEFFPSPSVFVYTLPNILTGEISIRNHYHGETCHYLLPSHDKEKVRNIVEATFSHSGLKSAIVGWVDYTNDSKYIANIQLIELNQA